jgi:predicted O-methyltransferase YrrM
MRFDRLRFVNFVAAKTSPKVAPKPASWVFAEDFVAETEQAAQARERAAQLGVSPISRGSASALTLLARVVQARAVVEVGTGSGVSGLALFAGMQPDGVLTSVDIEPEHQQAAREAFLGVGIPTQRFRLIAGPALSVLPRLSDRGYDMVFIDADKTEYAEYVEEGLRLLRYGGVLALDNALWHDRTADESHIDAETEAVRKALSTVSDNEDLVSSLLPVGDGLLVAVKQ